MTDTILVTGGTGRTGAGLAARLRQAGVPCRIASRHPAQDAASVQVRFDWEDETTYGPALDGVEAIYLVAPVSAADPELILFPERVMVPVPAPRPRRRGAAGGPAVIVGHPRRRSGARPSSSSGV